MTYLITVSKTNKFFRYLVFNYYLWKIFKQVLCLEESVNSSNIMKNGKISLSISFPMCFRKKDIFVPIGKIWKINKSIGKLKIA